MALHNASYCVPTPSNKCHQLVLLLVLRIASRNKMCEYHYVLVEPVQGVASSHISTRTRSSEPNRRVTGCYLTVCSVRVSVYTKVVYVSTDTWRSLTQWLGGGRSL